MASASNDSISRDRRQLRWLQQQPGDDDDAQVTLEEAVVFACVGSGADDDEPAGKPQQVAASCDTLDGDEKPTLYTRATTVHLGCASVSVEDSIFANFIAKESVEAAVLRESAKPHRRGAVALGKRLPAQSVPEDKAGAKVTMRPKSRSIKPRPGAVIGMKPRPGAATKTSSSPSSAIAENDTTTDTATPAMRRAIFRRARSIQFNSQKADAEDDDACEPTSPGAAALKKFTGSGGSFLKIVSAATPKEKLRSSVFAIASATRKYTSKKSSSSDFSQPLVRQRIHDELQEQVRIAARRGEFRHFVALLRKVTGEMDGAEVGTSSTLRETQQQLKSVADAAERLCELRKRAAPMLRKLRWLPGTLGDSAGGPFEALEANLASTTISEARKYSQAVEDAHVNLKVCLRNASLGRVPTCPQHHEMVVRSAETENGNEAVCGACGEALSSDPDAARAWKCPECTCLASFFLCDGCAEGRLQDEDLNGFFAKSSPIEGWDDALTAASCATEAAHTKIMENIESLAGLPTSLARDPARMLQDIKMKFILPNPSARQQGVEAVRTTTLSAPSDDGGGLRDPFSALPSPNADNARGSSPGSPSHSRSGSTQSGRQSLSPSSGSRPGPVDRAGSSTCNMDTSEGVPNARLFGDENEGQASILPVDLEGWEATGSLAAANAACAWISLASGAQLDSSRWMYQSYGQLALDVPQLLTARVDPVQAQEGNLQATSSQRAAAEQQATDTLELDQAAAGHLKLVDIVPPSLGRRGGATRQVSGAPQAHHFCRALRRVVPRPLVGSCGPRRIAVEAVTAGRWGSQEPEPAPPKRMKQRIRSARRTREAVEADCAARRLLRLSGVEGMQDAHALGGSYAVAPVEPRHGACPLDLHIWNLTMNSWRARLSDAEALRVAESELAVFEGRIDGKLAEGSTGPAATSSTAMPTIADFSTSAGADAADLELDDTSWLLSDAFETEFPEAAAHEAIGAAADSGEKRWLQSSCSTRAPTSMGLRSEMGSATPDAMWRGSSRPGRAPPSTPPMLRRGCHSLRAWTAHLDRRCTGHVPLPPV